jgi:hypothetical protein
MLIASLGFPYIPFKTDTIHKGVCNGNVSLKILVEKSLVRGLLEDWDLDIKIILKQVSNIVGWCETSFSGIWQGLIVESCGHCSCP